MDHLDAPYFMTTVSGYDNMKSRQKGVFELFNLENGEEGACLILPLKSTLGSLNKVGMAGVNINPAKITIAVQLYERTENLMCVVAADSGSGKSFTRMLTMKRNLTITKY